MGLAGNLGQVSGDDTRFAVRQSRASFNPDRPQRQGGGGMPEAPTFQLFRSVDDTETFPAGSTIFRAGETGETMYAVQEGEIDLLVGDIVVETVKEGGIFGEMALIEHQPRTATAVARTDARLAVIDERRFTFLTQNTPNFALNVLRLISRRLRDTNRMV
jgi:CRP-like cAMP-binding protein